MLHTLGVEIRVITGVSAAATVLILILRNACFLSSSRSLLFLSLSVSCPSRPRNHWLSSSFLEPNFTMHLQPRSVLCSLRIVNTYGNFGSVTKTRGEVVLKGTRHPDPADPAAEWSEYGKRGF